MFHVILPSENHVNVEIAKVTPFPGHTEGETERRDEAPRKSGYCILPLKQRGQEIHLEYC